MGRQKTKVKKIFSIILAILLFTLTTNTYSLEDNKADCERALLKCGVTAGLLALANPPLGQAWGAACLGGYIWCLQFIQ